MPFELFFQHLSGETGRPGPVLALAEWWPEVVEILSKPVSIAIVSAGILGLVVGWLVRGRDTAVAGSVATGAEGGKEAGWEELRWRHEKLVLTERQQVEKQLRLNVFADVLAGFDTPPEMVAALRLFVLAERVREARQKLGSDLSRMSAVRDRLDEVLAANGGAKGILPACRGTADSQVGMLEGVREELRGIAEEIVSLEERVLAGEKTFSLAEADWRKRLMDVKGRVLALPPGWSTSGDDADRRIRELLAPVAGREIEAMRDFLLVDGAITGSLSGSGEQDLVGAINRSLAAIEEAKAKAKAEKEDEAQVEVVEEVLGSDEELPAPEGGATPIGVGALEKPEPDPQFRAPGEFADLTVHIGKGFHDLTNGASGPSGAGDGNRPGKEAELPVDGTREELEEELEEESRSLVLFCSNDVELWGKDVYRGAHCRARAIREFPEWAQWISIRRLDSGERVFAPMKTASLRTGQNSDPFGFNGTNEMFYGARHLGIFSDSCPNEVETRFTYGGWGFGHRAHEIAPEVEQLQAAGWEGREIPSDTVFEIAIHEELPELGSQDRLLEGGEVGRGS